MDAFFRVLGFDCYDKHRFTELLVASAKRASEVEKEGAESCRVGRRPCFWSVFARVFFFLFPFFKGVFLDVFVLSFFVWDL